MIRTRGQACRSRRTSSLRTGRVDLRRGRSSGGCAVPGAAWAPALAPRRPAGAQADPEIAAPLRTPRISPARKIRDTRGTHAPKGAEAAAAPRSATSYAKEGCSSRCRARRRIIRRGGDSNPRYANAYTGFRNRPVQPLRHLSWSDAKRQATRYRAAAKHSTWPGQRSCSRASQPAMRPCGLVWTEARAVVVGGSTACRKRAGICTTRAGPGRRPPATAAALGDPARGSRRRGASHPAHRAARRSGRRTSATNQAACGCPPP